MLQVGDKVMYDGRVGTITDITDIAKGLAYYVEFDDVQYDNWFNYDELERIKED